MGFLSTSILTTTTVITAGYGQPEPLEELLGPQLSYPPGFTDPQDPKNWTKTCNNVANEAAKHYVLESDILACLPWYNATILKKYGVSPTE